MGKKMIWTTFEKEGFHAFPGAPDDVSYLRARHRHLFKFKVAMEVAHDDREIEFHLFRRELLALYEDGALELENHSCEMLADVLHGYLKQKYRGRQIVISISEDGENGVDAHYEGEAA